MIDVKEFVYSIEMFKNGEWVTEKRIYQTFKQFGDFDLIDVAGLRRNAQLVINDPNIKEDEWPMPEVEDKFDWSLSMAQIEKKYLSKKIHYVFNGEIEKQPVIKKKKPVLPVKKKTEMPVFPKKAAADQIATGSSKCINYLGKDCPCVGFIDRSIGYGTKSYQDAYYHSGVERYIFKISEGIAVMPKESVEKFLKPFYPDTADIMLSVNTNTPKIKKQDPVERFFNSPEPNFHCE